MYWGDPEILSNISPRWNLQFSTSVRRQKTHKLAPNCFYWFVYRYSTTVNFQVRRSARFFQMNLWWFSLHCSHQNNCCLWMFVHPLIQWDMIGSICSFGPFWTHPKLIEDIIPPMNHDPKNDPAKKRCLGSWVELSRGRVIRVIFAATFPLKPLVFF